MPEEKKEPKNIEELLLRLRTSVTPEHKKNIQLYEKHMKVPAQAKLERQFISPAFEGKGEIQGAYRTAEKQVDTLYKDGKVDVKDAERMHKVLVGYMVGYFEHAMPGVLQALPGQVKNIVDRYRKNQAVTKDEIKTAYEHLAHHFDQEVGAGQIEGVQGLSGLEEAIKEQFEGEEEFTADMLKNFLSGLVEGHKKGVSASINAHAQASYIASLPRGAYAAYVIDKAKKTGRKISDLKEALFHRLNTNTIASDIHLPLIRKQEDGIRYKKHGFYIPEPKEKAA